MFTIVVNIGNMKEPPFPLDETRSFTRQDCLITNVLLKNDIPTTIKDIPVIPLLAFYCLSNEHFDSSDNLWI